MPVPSRKTRTTMASRAITAVVLALAVLVPQSVGAAEDSAGRIWFIGTHWAARGGRIDAEAQEKRFTYYRLAPDGTWEQAGRGKFLETTEPAVPTTIYIHGNRTGPSGAVCDAWRIHRRMKRDAAGRPFRLVIWSWPAGRVCRRIRADVQTKACYSDTQGYYLARLLADVPRDARVTLVGYSFGARVITGALHILGGGKVAGRELNDGQLPKSSTDNGAGRGEEPERSAGKRIPFRAVLVAAALDAGSLSPGCRNHLATTQVDRILVTCNPCDRVLRWYPRLYGRSGPEAMGYAGACCCGPPCDKIEQVDVTCSVGRNHSWARYTCSEPLMQRLAEYTFLEDASPRSP